MQYGALSHDPDRYPLFYLKSKKWIDTQPSILVQGGVHGYEPSGIFAAIEHAESFAKKGTSKTFNLASFPCISPWAYEMDHRWNYHAQDPNRGYTGRESNTEECVAFMNAIRDIGCSFTSAIDLHETPDRDRTLRIMRASRFGSPLSEKYRDIPQGFYLALDSVYKDQRKTPDFTASIIKNVSSCVNIAKDNFIMDQPNYNGVIYMDIPGLGETWLRENNYTKYVATTEVYSDSIGAQKAIEAQISAIEGMENCILGNCDMN